MLATFRLIDSSQHTYKQKLNIFHVYCFKDWSLFVDIFFDHLTYSYIKIKSDIP